MHKIELMDRYFNDYRKKFKDVEQIISQRREMLGQIEQMDNKLISAQAELTHMKKVISLMIEKDLDPVEAQLTVEDTQDIILTKSEIWTDMMTQPITLDQNGIYSVTSDISSAFQYGNTYLDVDS